MEKQDIISGLRNAVDRGYSIELAVQSFMNAGYNKQDVLDSAKVLGFNTGIISRIPINQPTQSLSQSQQIPQVSSQEIQPQRLPQQQNIQQISQEIKQPQSQAQVQPQQPHFLSSPKQISREKSWFAENWVIIFLVLVLILLLSGLFFSIFAKDWVSSLLGLG